nr:receptor-like protein 9DC3 [Nicotiana tomentosiformis]
MGYKQLSVVLLVVFLYHELAFSSSTLPQLCNKDQSISLLKFKQMFTVDPSASHFCSDYGQNSYPKTSTWNMSSDCCLWDGVTCDEFTGHVIELDLSCSQLKGSLISKGLTFLLLTSFLRKSHLYLAGQIPSEISHLSKLQSLYLLGNALSLGPHNFKLLLQNLTQLRELDLSEVSISSTIPLNISYHITTLTLEYTGLHEALPEISIIFNIKVLFLSEVNFSGDFLPESLVYLTSFLGLNLNFCNLSGPIPESLWNLTRIEYMDLRYNDFGGPIPLSISGLQNLEFLSLSNNNLNGEIPSWIYTLPSLTKLGLRDNHFSGQLEDFKSNSLINISLGGNQLQGHLPKSIQNLVNLTRLHLSSNNFSGNVDVSFFSNLKQLDSLDLSYNNLRSNFLQGSLPILPSSLSNLFISNNSLSGKIPSSFCNLTSLTVLDLARNNLKGAIPQCLGNLSDYLQVLDMQHNSLSGNLQTTFRVGSRLTSFNLHGNKLEGKIPKSLANCKELEVLDLGKNNLNDTFPMWLGTLPKLQVLSLRSNKLHGPIRASRAKNLFPHLQILDLSCNAFTAELPTSLFHHLKAMMRIDQTMEPPSDDRYYEDSVTVVTKGLELEVVRILYLYTTMDLSNNKFEGQIPSIMGDLIALRVLNLSHNGLQGHIPKLLGNLSVVESLDLSFNQLSGEIPQQLDSVTSLTFLNLSHNHLQGCIPQGPQFHTFDNNSYEGNDGLRGFPVSEGCGSSRMPKTNNTTRVLDEESTSQFLNDFWKATLMGYGSGLIIGLSIAYIMLSARNPNWLSWIVEELEHKITMRRRKKQRGQRHYRRRNNGV